MMVGSSLHSSSRQVSSDSKRSCDIRLCLATSSVSDDAHFVATPQKAAKLTALVGQTSSRPSDIGGSFASRRSHAANQLSISDTNHHVTETIGTLYGDDYDYPNEKGRPTSVINGPYGGEDSQHNGPSLQEGQTHRLARVPSGDAIPQSLDSITASEKGEGFKNGGTAPSRMPSQTSNSSVGAKSPTLRDMREEESSQFPIGNIEDPNDIALELSNLQALRRMSMDVSNNHDPDLPFQGASLIAIPSIAPQGDDDEADPSRLLWVPAGVHPELAPTEFKNFLEKRVQSMKRRSGDSIMSVDSMDSGVGGGLGRKKSMLSRQIDNRGGRGAEGYVDGATRLDRKKSVSQHVQHPPELSLNELVTDPSGAVQKLALEAQRESALEGMPDLPILPVAPGVGLRRATRTTYRKGGSLKDRHGESLKSIERPPFAKRTAESPNEDNEGRDKLPSVTLEDNPLTRVQSEPAIENFSRPNRPLMKQRLVSAHDSGKASLDKDHQHPVSNKTPRRAPSDSAIRTPGLPIPQITKTPAAEKSAEPQATRPFPGRGSSPKQGPPLEAQPPIPSEPPARSAKRINPGQAQTPQTGKTENGPQLPAQASSNLRGHPSGSTQPQNFLATSQSAPPSPISGSTRTDGLTLIPTFASEEKKSDKKHKKEKSDVDSHSTKGTGWKWFKGSDDKDKKKDETKKAKAKATADKAHDNVRLDVLQTSIDAVNKKGRESLLLDREIVDSRLDEERKKEGARKSGEQKKEKDGLFANLFGGSKKKSDRDSGAKKSQNLRPVSPEPPPRRRLKPDVDYHWTRFPILEERAIYRMAHIKLANPRRSLSSQVLLSNFMYAYLAKVQAMHPQIQVPQSPAQKRAQEEERRRREAEQQKQAAEQQQAQENIDRYNFEYHRVSLECGIGAERKLTISSQPISMEAQVDHRKGLSRVGKVTAMTIKVARAQTKAEVVLMRKYAGRTTKPQMMICGSTSGSSD